MKAEKEKGSAQEAAAGCMCRKKTGKASQGKLQESFCCQSSQSAVQERQQNTGDGC